MKLVPNEMLVQGTWIKNLGHTLWTMKLVR